MPLFIIKNDITKLKVDAIVNAANSSLLGGSGVDGAIHRAAGPDLLKECKTLNGCETGDAKITKGYNLPAKYVIHTVGPIWHGGKRDEEKLLTSCYNRSLQLAVENQCKSVAFPMISAGIYGYPKAAAMKVAKMTICHFLAEIEDELDVYIVLFGSDTSEFITVEDETLNKLKSDLDNVSEEINIDEGFEKANNSSPFTLRNGTFISRRKPNPMLGTFSLKPPSELGFKLSKLKNKLKDLLFKKEENFSEMIMRKIEESKLDEVKCYKSANVNKQIFYKIRKSASNVDGIPYQPSKNVVFSFAIALKLNLQDTKELLEKAGYSLSKSNKMDIIIEYCISNGIYDVFTINEILLYFSLPLLGSKCNE